MIEVATQVGMAQRMDVCVGEEERKLIEIPRASGALRAEVRRFEEERGCEVGMILVAARRFIEVLRLVGLAGADGVTVRVDDECRDGVMVLVGG